MQNQQKNSALKKIMSKAKEAHEKHKNDKTEINQFAELPAGIKDGVAQLIECKFDVYKKGDNKGEPYFIATGIVVEPKEFNGRKIEGLRTQIMEPVHDTPKRTRTTVEDHISWIYNNLRLLGLDTSSIDFEDLEHSMTVLKETKPYFAFETWRSDPTKEFPNPKTNHKWLGAVDYTQNSDEDVDDNTETVSSNKSRVDSNEDDTDSIDDDLEFGDLQSLVKLASAKDRNAQKKLGDLALKAGLSTEDFENAESWSDVAQMIKNGSKSGSSTNEVTEEETIDDEESKPNVEVGQIVEYQPPTDKNGKKSKKVTCKVLRVNDDGSVDLRSLVDKSTLKGIRLTS